MSGVEQRPRFIATSEDEPIVWLARTCSRLAAIRAGADECCGRARHFWARKRYMREATKDLDCPCWPHEIGEDEDPPEDCRCWQIEEGWFFQCAADEPGAEAVWRVEERPHRIRWRLRRLSGKILYRRRCFDGRKSVLWGGKLERKATRLDRWLGAPGFYLLADRWLRPEPIRWIYCDVCRCLTPRRVEGRPTCLANGHLARQFPITSPLQDSEGGE